MSEVTAAPVKIVGPGDAKEGFLGSIGVRFMIDGSEAGDRFSLVEHAMSPRALAAPRAALRRLDALSSLHDYRRGLLWGEDRRAGRAAVETPNEGWPGAHRD